LSLTNLQSLPILEDAAPMAAAEQLGQAVIEFDPTATVETVVIEESTEVMEVAEVATEEAPTELAQPAQEPSEDVVSESGEPSDETK